MKIVAKTEKGFLVSATLTEIESILSAVIGKDGTNIQIGQKIPAIDYAATITKIKMLYKNYAFQQIFSRLEAFNETAEELKNVIEQAKNLTMD